MSKNGKKKGINIFETIIFLMLISVVGIAFYIIFAKVINSLPEIKIPVKIKKTEKIQKVVFCVHMISYKPPSSKEECQNACSAIAVCNSGNDLILYGWKIISSAPKKEVIYSGYYRECVCIGTEYVIEKEVEK